MDTPSISSRPLLSVRPNITAASWTRSKISAQKRRRFPAYSMHRCLRVLRNRRQVEQLLPPYCSPATDSQIVKAVIGSSGRPIYSHISRCVLIIGPFFRTTFRFRQTILGRISERKVANQRGNLYLESCHMNFPVVQARSSNPLSRADCRATKRRLSTMHRTLLTSDIHANRVKALTGSDEQRAPVLPAEADVGRGFRNLDGGDVLALGTVDMHHSARQIQVSLLV